MKILIGTPIHMIKDYCMERWLDNVSKLKSSYNTDLLLVDNSPDLDYSQKVKEYCKRYGIEDYQLVHIDVHQENGADERIGRSREAIRQYVLAFNYDAWFSWESDQIIPLNSLEILSKIMTAGNYLMVNHNSWTREMPAAVNAAFGCSLINKHALEKYGFLLEYPDMPNSWHAGDAWFKKRVIKGGGSYIEVYGIINPIYHLNK